MRRPPGRSMVRFRQGLGALPRARARRGGGHMELSLSTRTVGDHTVLEVGGEVDVYTAPRLRERLVELVEAGARRGGVDLSRGGVPGSTGLGGPGGAPQRWAAPRRRPAA